MKLFKLSLASLILLGSLLQAASDETKSAYYWLDDKSKGKSHGGSQNDDSAIEDGMGIIVIDGPGTPPELIQEIEEVKILHKVLKDEKDPKKREKIIDNLPNAAQEALTKIKTLPEQATIPTLPEAAIK